MLLVLLVVLVVAAVVIRTPTFTLWLSDPLVPVTCTVNGPVDDEADALIVRVEVAGVAVGVTGPGRLIETPEGAAPIHE
jgi:hypothetical protein